MEPREDSSGVLPPIPTQKRQLFDDEAVIQDEEGGDPSEAREVDIAYDSDSEEEE